jgi:uncharacterized protein (TIGR03435 family)
MSGLGGVNRYMARMQSMSDITGFFEGRLQGSVQDKTGLTGLCDFVLEFSRDGSGGQVVPRTADAPITGEASTPSPDLFTAVRQQLGLKPNQSRSRSIR